MSKVKFRTAYGEKNKVVVDTSDALTEQHHKDQCDIGRILSSYDKTGVLSHVNASEAQYGDISGDQYQDMLFKVSAVNSAFEGLPSEIRNEFDNDASKYLEFMSNEENMERAVELGLVEAPQIVGDKTAEAVVETAETAVETEAAPEA